MLAPPGSLYSLLLAPPGNGLAYFLNFKSFKQLPGDANTRKSRLPALASPGIFRPFQSLNPALAPLGSNDSPAPASPGVIFMGLSQKFVKV